AWAVGGDLMPVSATQPTVFERIIRDYFTHPAQRVTLLPGDVLMDQGEFNERLYYVHSGQLIATVSAPDDVGEEEQAELFWQARAPLSGCTVSSLIGWWPLAA
ncbi:MAG: hypothetical protein ACRCYJ_08795, partial [Plesiomonas shigelloides]